MPSRAHEFLSHNSMISCWDSDFILGSPYAKWAEAEAGYKTRYESGQRFRSGYDFATSLVCHW
jgi:hypothetical protein